MKNIKVCDARMMLKCKDCGKYFDITYKETMSVNLCLEKIKNKINEIKLFHNCKQTKLKIV